MSDDPPSPLKGYISREGYSAIIWALFSIVTLFLGARLASRWHLLHGLLVDDYWLVVAWLALLAQDIVFSWTRDSLWEFLLHKSGYQPRPPEDTMPNVKLIMYGQVASVMLFLSIITAVKASFLTTFYQLAKPLKWACNVWYGVAILTVLSYIVCMGYCSVTLASADELVSLDKEISKKTRQEFTAGLIMTVAADVITHLMIIAIPLTILPGLQLNSWRKGGLATTFSLALFIIAVALIRLAQVFPGRELNMIRFNIWGVAETSVAVLMGSLLPLWMPIGRYIRKLPRE